MPLTRTQLTGLVVCEASSDEGTLRYLPHAADEARIVRACFDSAKAQVINNASANTPKSESTSLIEASSAHILHLACHAVQDPDPLMSAIQLQDARLSVADIMSFSLLQPLLAYLSACHTARGDRDAPDQAVHLAASMLFCGFRSVIATMWCALPFRLRDISHVVIGSCTTRTDPPLHDVSTSPCLRWIY
jgi:CHAT domain-containing protein